uniref:Uncharacterized protein n=1 Tax=Ixodes scapularis TaxID=6945 RepID=A0A4D5RCP1_IXOSC
MSSSRRLISSRSASLMSLPLMPFSSAASPFSMISRASPLVSFLTAFFGWFLLFNASFFLASRFFLASDGILLSCVA